MDSNKKAIKKPANNRLEADAFEVKDTEGQTVSPEYYGHGPVYITKDEKAD